MFYTTTLNSGIIPPRLESIGEYQSEIEKQQKQLEALHKKQYNSMLQNDGATVDALEVQSRMTQTYIDSLKERMGVEMGSSVHGRRGNQLLGGVPDEKVQASSKPGLKIGNTRPQFAANDTAAHMTGLEDEESASKWYDNEGRKQQHKEQMLQYKEGMSDSSSGYSDFFQEQREKEQRWAPTCTAGGGTIKNWYILQIAKRHVLKSLIWLSIV